MPLLLTSFHTKLPITAGSYKPASIVVMSSLAFTMNAAVLPSLMTASESVSEVIGVLTTRGEKYKTDGRAKVMM